jgi:hypothetical protein
MEIGFIRIEGTMSSIPALRPNLAMLYHSAEGSPGTLEITAGMMS